MRFKNRTLGVIRAFLIFYPAKLRLHQPFRSMIKQTFFAVSATVLLASGSAFAQGTPVQGSDSTRANTMSADSAAMKSNGQMMKSDDGMMKTDNGTMMTEEKMKMDRKGKKVKDKKTTYR